MAGLQDPSAVHWKRPPPSSFSSSDALSSSDPGVQKPRVEAGRAQHRPCKPHPPTKLRWWLCQCPSGVICYRPSAGGGPRACLFSGCPGRNPDVWPSEPLGHKQTQLKGPLSHRVSAHPLQAEKTSHRLRKTHVKLLFYKGVAC